MKGTLFCVPMHFVKANTEGHSDRFIPCTDIWGKKKNPKKTNEIKIPKKRLLVTSIETWS